MKKQVIIGLIAGLIFNTTILPVQADIVTDIRAGVSPQQVVQLALGNKLAPIQIVTQLITAGVNPITSAVIVARALPHEAINIAVAAVVAKTQSCQKLNSAEERSNCLELVSQIAIGIADAVAEVVPDKREAIINAVAQAAPEAAIVIANFYPDPTAQIAHPAFTQQETTLTIPPPPSLSQTNSCERKDCNVRDPRFPNRKIFLCCASSSFN